MLVMFIKNSECMKNLFRTFDNVSKSKENSYFTTFLLQRHFKISAELMGLWGSMKNQLNGFRSVNKSISRIQKKMNISKMFWKYVKPIKKWRNISRLQCTMKSSWKQHKTQLFPITVSMTNLSNAKIASLKWILTYWNFSGKCSQMIEAKKTLIDR